MDDEERKLKDFYEPFFSLFPDYYKVFDELINNVMYKDIDCSFSLKDKLFLGLMGSSTIGCEFLLNEFKRRYAISFDDQSWMDQGLQCKDIPKRIKNISIINNILAHKPWIMDCRNFTVFENGLSTFLFQSAIILTTVQRFATILCTFKIIIHYGINEEKNKINNEKDNYGVKLYEQIKNIEKIIKENSDNFEKLLKDKENNKINNKNNNNEEDNINLENFFNLAKINYNKYLNLINEQNDKNLKDPKSKIINLNEI
jgi:hypothetical protein